MIVPKNIGQDRAARAGKILIGGMIALPFIPLNKKTKYSSPNYPSNKSKFSEWVRCCRD